jgi:hypothetical protein
MFLPNTCRETRVHWARIRSRQFTPVDVPLDRQCSDWNRAACSGKVNTDSKRSHRCRMQPTDIAPVLFRSNRKPSATGTTDIPGREQSQGRQKQPAYSIFIRSLCKWRSLFKWHASRLDVVAAPPTPPGHSAPRCRMLLGGRGPGLVPPSIARSGALERVSQIVANNPRHWLHYHFGISKTQRVRHHQIQANRHSALSVVSYSAARSLAAAHVSGPRLG